MNYEDYLKSPEWKQRAEAAKERAGWRCQVCNKDRGQLHAHHRTYERLGAEDPMDITVLCEHCHKLFHGKIARRSTTAVRKWREVLQSSLRRFSPSWVVEERDAWEQVERYCSPERLTELWAERRSALDEDHYLDALAYGEAMRGRLSRRS